MEMWKWESGEHWSGVCGSADVALAHAETHLAVGDTARVERVRAELSFRTMSSFYVLTGDGWTATREAAGPEPVTWQPLGSGRRRSVSDASGNWSMDACM